MLYIRVAVLWRLVFTGIGSLSLLSCSASSVEQSQVVAEIQVPGASNVMVPKLVFVDGAPMVLYYDDSNTTLYAAYPDGEFWETETVEPSAEGIGATGLYLAAVRDAQGNVHAAYRDDSTQNLRYLTGTRGNWSAVDPLPPGEDRGRGLDITVDLGGNPWIAYRNETTQALEVVHRSEQNWLVESVDSEGNTGLWPAIDHDLGGRVSVSYRNASSNTVRLAQFENIGQWDLQTVAEGAIGSTLGKWMALALRAGNREDLSLVFPRLLFLNEQDATYTLQFAQPDGDGGWLLETIDPNLFGGSDNCMTVDSRGNVWIAYLDAVALNLKVARRSAGGKWRTATLDSRPSSGFWSDCQVDAAGALHVVYTQRDESNARILYRTYTDGF